MPIPKPMPGVGAPPELLGELVVAPSPADRRLRGVDEVGQELERGAGVVVEPPHEPRRELVPDAQPVEPHLDALEVRAATRR